MRELPGADPEDERFQAKMTVFQELIKHHVEEEESEMFKLARRLGDQELEELGDRMMRELEAAGADTGPTAGTGRQRSSTGKRKRAA
jgi:hemerythrin-like domain-containing protein